jgi:hypothetical protein
MVRRQWRSDSEDQLLEMDLAQHGSLREFRAKKNTEERASLA